MKELGPRKWLALEQKILNAKINVRRDPLRQNHGINSDELYLIYRKKCGDMEREESCFDKKYLNHPYVAGVRSKRKLYRIFRKKYRRYSELTRLLAPITALMYVSKWKILGVYFCHIIKEWAATLGYMWGWLTWVKKVEPAHAS
jgi:hypothetical protein